jgi:sugar phosphate isomerase/epimerase
MERIHEDIVACYLYAITRHGYPPVAANSLAHVAEFKELGFTSIELEGIRNEHLEGVHSRRIQIREKADALGIKIPVFCVVLPGLCSPDQAERELNLELFEKGCEVAVSLGSKVVLDNAPIPPWKFPAGIPITRHYDEEVLATASIPVDLDWEVYWDALLDTFRHVCDIAADRGLTYQLHPCYGALVNSTDAYLLFAEALKRDNLRFNLDTANQFFMKDNLFLSLIRLKDHIDYIHLSDNRGSKVEHLSMGGGEIHWGRFFETLDRIDYKGMFGIDVGGAESDVPDLDSAYRSSAAWLTDKWYKHRG